MTPYLDLTGFVTRSVMPAGDIAIVETSAPGFTATRITLWTSKINARLRKRYGNALPLGSAPPVLVASGVNPPGVVLAGKPTLGSRTYALQVNTPGADGVATFSYSLDGEQTFVSGGTIIAGPNGVPLGASGVSAVFSPGTYAVSDTYVSGTAVPEIVLEWITALVTVDLYRKRGFNPQDPAIQTVIGERDRALEELKESADSAEGLLDIAVSDDGASAVNTGGPIGTAQASPYAWTDDQRNEGRQEDQGIPPSGTGIVP